MTDMKVINLALEMYDYDPYTAKGISDSLKLRNGKHKKELDTFFHSLSIEEENRAEGLAKTLSEKIIKIWELLENIFNKEKISTNTRFSDLHKAYDNLTKNDQFFILIFKGHAKIACDIVNSKPEETIKELGLEVYNHISNGEKSMISKDFLSGKDSDIILQIERVLVSINKKIINRPFYPLIDYDKYIDALNRFSNLIKQSNIYEAGNMDMVNFLSEINSDKVDIVDKEYNYYCFKMDNLKQYYNVIDVAYNAEQSMLKFLQLKNNILNIIKSVEAKLNTGMARRSDFNVIDTIIKILKIFLMQYRLLFIHMPRSMEVFLNTMKEIRD